MTDSGVPALPLVFARADHIFPTLTAAQLARIRPHGHVRQIPNGEVLIEAGETIVPFFVSRQAASRSCGRRHHRDADCRPRPRRVHRRGEHDLGPPRALPRAGD